ncbi:hypothetical protein OXX80_001318 [Metschnikowia pulcherrima]
MKFITILPLLALAFADDLIRPGTLYIASVRNTPAYKDLSVSDGKLVVGSQLTNFEYKPDGSLYSKDHNKFLGVSNEGKLFLDSWPQTGFSVKSSRGSEYKRKLHYNNKHSFQLCGDKSIGLDSDCANARPVTIIYEDIIQPR